MYPLDLSYRSLSTAKGSKLHDKQRSTCVELVPLKLESCPVHHTTLEDRTLPIPAPGDAGILWLTDSPLRHISRTSTIKPHPPSSPLTKHRHPPYRQTPGPKTNQNSPSKTSPLPPPPPSLQTCTPASTRSRPPAASPSSVTDSTTPV